MTNKAILICGPSGAGKTTIMNALLKLDSRFQQCIGITTRDIRAGEKDGADYHFISVEKFEELRSKDKLLEIGFYNKNYYGYTDDSVFSIFNKNKIPVMCTTPSGVQRIGDLQKFGIYSVFIKPPSVLELKKRLESRKQHSEEQITERLQIAQEEMLEAHKCDAVIVGDIAQRAALEIRSGYDVSVLAAKNCSVI